MIDVIFTGYILSLIIIISLFESSKPMHVLPGLNEIVEVEASAKPVDLILLLVNLHSVPIGISVGIQIVISTIGIIGIGPIIAIIKITIIMKLPNRIHIIVICLIGLVVLTKLAILIGLTELIGLVVLVGLSQGVQLLIVHLAVIDLGLIVLGIVYVVVRVWGIRFYTLDFECLLD